MCTGAIPSDITAMYHPTSSSLHPNHFSATMGTEVTKASCTILGTISANKTTIKGVKLTFSLFFCLFSPFFWISGSLK